MENEIKDIRDALKTTIDHFSKVQDRLDAHYTDLEIEEVKLRQGLNDKFYKIITLIEKKLGV